MSEASKAPCGCEQILMRAGHFDHDGVWRPPVYETLHEFGTCGGVRRAARPATAPVMTIHPFVDLRVPDDGTFRFYVYEIVHGPRDGEWVVATTPLTYFALPRKAPAVLEWGAPPTTGPVEHDDLRCTRPASALSVDAKFVSLMRDRLDEFLRETAERVQAARCAGILQAR